MRRRPSRRARASQQAQRSACEEHTEDAPIDLPVRDRRSLNYAEPTCGPLEHQSIQAPARPPNHAGMSGLRYDRANGARRRPR